MKLGNWIPRTKFLLFAIALATAMLSPVKSGAAPPAGFTSDVWADYTDRYGMVHTTKVGGDRGPSSNNGLLFTAEACTIMQLQNVSYDKAKLRYHGGNPHEGRCRFRN